MFNVGLAATVEFERDGDRSLPCPNICGYGYVYGPILLPHAHVQGVKQLVLSVCRLSVIVTTKIAISRGLGILVTHKHNESVEIGEKLASACFDSFDTAHECHKYCIFVGHAYRPRLL